MPRHANSTTKSHAPGTRWYLYLVGDEREGDEKGDDESIHIDLGLVHESVSYIGIVVNSYSGQELNDGA